MKLDQVIKAINVSFSTEINNSYFKTQKLKVYSIFYKADSYTFSKGPDHFFFW